jgi:hypothetical protein
MKARLLLITAGVLLACTACTTQPNAPAKNPPTMTPAGQSASVASDKVMISKVTMYRDNGSGEPDDEVTVFKPADRVMHFLAEASGLKTGQNVKLVFTAVDTTAGRNMSVAEAETGKLLVANQITGKVSLDRDWPVGSYKMDIYVDGSLIYAWNYAVKE